MNKSPLRIKWKTGANFHKKQKAIKGHRFLNSRLCGLFHFVNKNRGF